MGKTRFIALVLVISFILFGVGYAWWSETITITSTVSTGELRVEFINLDADESNLSAPYIYKGYNFPHKETYREFIKSFDVYNQTMEAHFDGFFPGINYIIPFEIQNKGTIPAKFKNCSVSYEITGSSMTEEEKAELIDELKKNLWVTNMYFYGVQTGTIKLVNGSYVQLGELSITLADLAANPTSQLANFQLMPENYPGDNTIDGELMCRFSEDFGNNFQDRDFTISIKLEWTQFNNNEI